MLSPMNFIALALTFRYLTHFELISLRGVKLGIHSIVLLIDIHYVSAPFVEKKMFFSIEYSWHSLK